MRVEMLVTTVTDSLVAREASSVARDADEPHVAQTYEIPEDGGPIPVGRAELFRHLAMTEWARRSAEHSQHGYARAGDTETQGVEFFLDGSLGGGRHGRSGAS
jgi:hypothetical protein